jgi:hypothetical protein
MASQQSRPAELLASGRRLDELIREAMSYQDLPVDWDTYGGLPASPQAVRFATQLLRSVDAARDPLPEHISPISTGIFLEWTTGDARLAFEVDENSVLYSLRRQDQIVERGEDTAFDVERAAALVALLRSGN